MAILESLLRSTNVFQEGIVDKTTGEALAAGIITCYKDNNRTELKNWYYQSGTPGNYSYIALPNPLTLSAAGTIQDPSGNDVLPFFYPYSEVSESTREPYYITVYSANNVLQFTRENFPFLPTASSQGVSDSLKNLIINNRFWRNTGETISNNNEFSTTLTDKTDIVLCPSQHDAFTQPDFRFGKSNTTAVETMIFNKFTLPEAGLPSPAITPEFYVTHQCTAKGTESQKYYQFPLSMHLRTIEGQTCTFTMFAKNNNGNPNNELKISVVKFTGSDASGGTYTDVPLSTSDTLDLSPDWAFYTLTGAIPSAAADTVTDTGDDAFYIRINLPTTTTCDVSFALPSLYIGVEYNESEFHTYDMIDSQICTPRTGDYRASLNPTSIAGWIPCNDGSIGSRNSAATTLKAQECWPLYKFLWDNVSQAFAPVSGGSGRGATAYDDWISNNTMTLPKVLGRALMGANPKFTSPSPATVTVTPVNISSVNVTNEQLILSTSISFSHGDQVRFTSTGTLPAPLVADTTYYVIVVSSTAIQLAVTLEDALVGTQINITSVGSGTISITNTVYDWDLSVTTNDIVGGSPVYLEVSTGGVLPAAFTESTIYYVSTTGLTASTVRLASSLDDALNGHYEGIFDAGSGTFTIYPATGANTGVSYQTEPPLHKHDLDVPAGKNAAFAVSGTADGSFGRTFAEVWSNPKTKNAGLEKMGVIQPSFITNVFLKL